MSLEYAGRDAFLDEFHLKPEYREGGIGSSALSQAEEHLAGMAVRAMYLMVMPGNDRAEQFYRRAGYDDTGACCFQKGWARTNKGHERGGVDGSFRTAGRGCF